MSVLVTSRIGRGRVGNVTEYLERDKPGAEYGRVEACISDIGNGPDSYRAGLSALLDPTSRKCDGQSLVISFSEREFDPAGDHGAAVAGVAYEVARRGAPDAPLLVVSQRDGVGGKWHAHIIVGNHNMTTGKADRGAWRHDEWRSINDDAMRDFGLEVCGRDAALSRTQRVAAARGIDMQADADLIAMPPSAVPRDRVDSYIGAHVSAALIDGRISALPDPGHTATVALPNDADHRLSVRATGTGLSYAIVGADDTPAMCAPGTRGGKPRAIASTGTKLDRALGRGAADATFTRPGAAALLAALRDEMEQEHERDREGQNQPDARVVRGTSDAPVAPGIVGDGATEPTRTDVGGGTRTRPRRRPRTRPVIAPAEADVRPGDARAEVEARPEAGGRGAGGFVADRRRRDAAVGRGAAAAPTAPAVTPPRRETTVERLDREIARHTGTTARDRMIAAEAARRGGNDRGVSL